MRTRRARTIASAALLAAVLAAGVPAARAAQAEGAAVDGAVTLAKYTSCAAGLAVAENFAMAWGALMNCAKMIADEWNRTF